MIQKKRVVYLTVVNIMGSQIIEKSTALSKKFTNYEKMFFQKKTYVFNDYNMQLILKILIFHMDHCIIYRFRNCEFEEIPGRCLIKKMN